MPKGHLQCSYKGSHDSELHGESIGDCRWLGCWGLRHYVATLMMTSLEIKLIGIMGFDLQYTGRSSQWMDAD